MSDPLFEVYNLSADAVSHGIPAGDYDSVIPDADTVNFAAVTLIPVLPGKPALTPESSALSLAFLRGFESSKSSDKGGAILSYDPEEWRLSTDRTRLVLLDPSGTGGRVLVYIRKGSRNVLESRSDKTAYLSVDAAGNPVISREHRGAMLLSALGAQRSPASETAPADSRPSVRRGKPRAGSR